MAGFEPANLLLQSRGYTIVPLKERIITQIKFYYTSTYYIEANS